VRSRSRPPGAPLLKQNLARMPGSATLGGMRRALWIVAAAGLVAVLVIGLTQAGDHGESGAPAKAFDLAAAKRKLAGAPGPLAALYGEADQLLGGGRKAFDDRLLELRGHPIVVNKWASWCSPCRAEFPIFQRVATERGTKTAFLGVNAGDKTPAARRFLADRPLPFPSYEDPKEVISRALEVPSNYPSTVFIDRKGRPVFTHTGQYVSADQLTTDIDRYLR
jgi:cytochrome c biogenesis protein CcmG, thiol:disulfide interchange protein DsbE